MEKRILLLLFSSSLFKVNPPQNHYKTGNQSIPAYEYANNLNFHQRFKVFVGEWRGMETTSNAEQLYLIKHQKCIKQFDEKVKKNIFLVTLNSLHYLREDLYSRRRRQPERNKDKNLRQRRHANWTLFNKGHSKLDL